jgi:hypothetical protein
VLQLGAPIYAVRGDGTNVYVASGDGHVGIYRATVPPSLRWDVIVANYPLPGAATPAARPRCRLATRSLSRGKPGPRTGHRGGFGR